MKVVVIVTEAITKSTTVEVDIEPFMSYGGELPQLDEDALKEFVKERYNSGDLDTELEVEDSTRESITVELQEDEHLDDEESSLEVGASCLPDVPQGRVLREFGRRFRGRVARKCAWGKLQASLVGEVSPTNTAPPGQLPTLG